jgi:MFS family permease
VFHPAREGIRFVRADPVLRGIAATSALSNLLFTAATALNVLFLVDTVGVSPGTAGMLFSIGSAAALLAAAVATKLARWLGSARIIWLSVAVTSPFNLFIPLAQDDWRIVFFVLGITVGGGGQLVYAITQLSYRQAVVPPAILGRVNATMRFLVMGALPVGGLLGGGLGTLIGVRATLVVIAAGLTVAPIFVILSPLRRTREISPCGPEWPPPR